MTTEIAVGIIGYGKAGRIFHAPIIQSVPSLKLKAIVTRRDNEVRYPGVRVLRDVPELLRDDDIGLVVVATPNRSHYELARSALLANKHVVVEKPFTTSSDQAQELIDLALRQNRVISVHQNRRWDGDFLTVKRLLGGNLLGRLVEFESHYDRFRNHPVANAWREDDREGSGVLFDLGAHLIDQALALFGLPKLIMADIRVQRDFARADDNFELILHYDKLKVTLKAGMLVREPGPRFILHGTEGSFVKYGLDPQEHELKSGRTPAEASWGEEQEDRWGTLHTQIAGLHVESRVETLAGCYQNYYQNIADAISGRAELEVKPEEALNTIRIIELAQKSSAQKCAVGLT
jgi:scyllo-inositol 2-dehydrogenase (NADP+)